MDLSVTDGCVVPLCTDQCAVARRPVLFSGCKWYFTVTGRYATLSEEWLCKRMAGVFVTTAILVTLVCYLYDRFSTRAAQNDLVCGVHIAKVITRAVTAHSCGARGDERARRGKGEWSTPQA